jgi:hypothetical protein
MFGAHPYSGEGISKYYEMSGYNPIMNEDLLPNANFVKPPYVDIYSSLSRLSSREESAVRTQLKDVKIYTPIDRIGLQHRVSLKPLDGFEELQHDQVENHYGYAVMVAFNSDPEADAFLVAVGLFTDENKCLVATLKDHDSSVIVLITDSQVEGGLTDYHDRRNLPGFLWTSAQEDITLLLAEGVASRLIANDKMSTDQRKLLASFIRIAQNLEYSTGYDFSSLFPNDIDASAPKELFHGWCLMNGIPESVMNQVVARICRVRKETHHEAPPA